VNKNVGRGHSETGMRGETLRNRERGKKTKNSGHRSHTDLIRNGQSVKTHGGVEGAKEKKGKGRNFPRKKKASERNVNINGRGYTESQKVGTSGVVSETVSPKG